MILPFVKSELDRMQREYEAGGIDSVDRTMRVTKAQQRAMVDDYFARIGHAWAFVPSQDDPDTILSSDVILTDFGKVRLIVEE